MWATFPKFDDMEGDVVAEIEDKTPAPYTLVSYDYADGVDVPDGMRPAHEMYMVRPEYNTIMSQ